MGRKQTPKMQVVPVLPVPTNDAEATGIFNAIFGTQYTVQELKEMLQAKKTAAKLPVVPPPSQAGGNNFVPQPKQVVLKEGHMYVGPLLHVATKDLLAELGRRSMGMLAVLVTADKTGKDQWQFAINGSSMMVNTLISAAIYEGRQWLEKNSSPY